jgi:hypothetical protein
VLEVWELRETELSDGDRTAGGRSGGGGGGAGEEDRGEEDRGEEASNGGCGGARPFPLPNTLPPPSVLREAMGFGGG